VGRFGRWVVRRLLDDPATRRGLADALARAMADALDERREWRDEDHRRLRAAVPPTAYGRPETLVGPDGQTYTGSFVGMVND
jgi:hypothetical protein